MAQISVYKTPGLGLTLEGGEGWGTRHPHRVSRRKRTNARTDAENGGQIIRRRGGSMVAAEGKSRVGSEP